MQISLSFTGVRDEVVNRLRESPTQTSAEEREAEIHIREALACYLEDNAAEGSVEVSGSISVSLSKP